MIWIVFGVGVGALALLALVCAYLAGSTVGGRCKRCGSLLAHHDSKDTCYGCGPYKLPVAAALALSVCAGLQSAGAATSLAWDASDTNAGPPAVLYRVFSSPVVAPTNAIWTIYGETAATSLRVTNNVWRMFQVAGVSAAGVESDPSNVVTNTLAPPAPPTNAIVRVSVQSAATPNGPWTSETNLPLAIPLAPGRFFRAYLTVNP